eukprot:8948415-Alexandrium_andersonii.AAC.1
MSASLVGSEMCIRDSFIAAGRLVVHRLQAEAMAITAKVVQARRKATRAKFGTGAGLGLAFRYLRALSAPLLQ